MFDVRVSDALHERAQRFIGGGQDDFDALATDIARHQSASSPAIARLYERRGVDVLALARAAEIPAVPTDAFKLLRVASHPPELDVVVFQTSGTTSGARGEHALRRKDTYETGAILGARELFISEITRPFDIVALMPPPAEAPESSLGFMCALFAEKLAGAGSFHLRNGALDVLAIERAVTAAAAVDRAVLLLSTSFALVHLFDELAGRLLPLPRGSRVMQTGGYKGKSREVLPEELRAIASRTFAVAESHVVAEYGMTELSSQAYETSPGVYRAPRWMRVEAVDPVTLEPVPAGNRGIARVVDLANVDSAVAIQTQDLVDLVPGGFRLHGRELFATPRGCSLAIEELLSR